jgi:hypothetical protein
MNVYEITDLTNTKVIDILKEGITEAMLANDKLHENYLYSHRDKRANLFSVLENGYYKNSTYFVITDDNDQYIASAGWNHYDESTALVLTRMLVIPEYRTSYVVGHTVLPTMIERTERYSNVWITCNEYNKSIYNWFDRASKGVSPSLYGKWPDVYKKFKPLGKRIVNSTEQYIVSLEK